MVGSILRPASFCGCVGFKPSVDSINRGGSYDYFSQGCTGVLAASLEDAWLVAITIAARAGADPGYPGLQGPPEPPAAQRPRALAVLEAKKRGRSNQEPRVGSGDSAARPRRENHSSSDHERDSVARSNRRGQNQGAGLTRAANRHELAGRQPPELCGAHSRWQSFLRHHGRARPSIRSGRAPALGLMRVSDGKQSGARIGMEGTGIGTGLSG